MSKCGGTFEVRQGELLRCILDAGHNQPCTTTGRSFKPHYGAEPSRCNGRLKLAGGVVLECIWNEGHAAVAKSRSTPGMNIPADWVYCCFPFPDAMLHGAEVQLEGAGPLTDARTVAILEGLVRLDLIAQRAQHAVGALSERLVDIDSRLQRLELGAAAKLNVDVERRLAGMELRLGPSSLECLNRTIEQRLAALEISAMRGIL